MIEQVEKHYGVFSKLVAGIGGKAEDFIGCVKLHIYNRLTHSVSTHKVLETYPIAEIGRYIGLRNEPAERSLYRTLERLGRNFPVILDNYQRLIQQLNLVDPNQVIDFSSQYIEGTKAELAEYGYSRDKRPDKLQINFGISTGINGVPTALTIQKGNTQDKKHMREILRVISKVIPENALLIFDTGGNSRKNKAKIRKMGYHYLTLRSKKVGTYRRHILYFRENLKNGNVKHFEINERHYSCVKKVENDETLYLFFCPELYKTQHEIKQHKFERQKHKGNQILKKRTHIRIPSDEGWVNLIPHLQRTIFPIENPYINGLEGFFILESSVVDEPEKILRLYKERDKAEKFIRSLKEGLELGPIRHWSKWAIYGIFLICFLTNFIINLTHLLSRASIVKNTKLLKKFLINLTLTVVYPPNGFRFTILSNVSPQILCIFGDFLRRYEDKSLNLRW